MLHAQIGHGHRAGHIKHSTGSVAIDEGGVGARAVERQWLVDLNVVLNIRARRNLDGVAAERFANGRVDGGTGRTRRLTGVAIVAGGGDIPRGG